MAPVVTKSADGLPLPAPNDLVCDELGGFWFSDHELVFCGGRHENATCDAFKQRPVGASYVAACRFDVGALAAKVGGSGGGAQNGKDAAE